MTIFESGLKCLQKLLDDPEIDQTDILIRQFTHEKDRSILNDALGRDIVNIILDLNDNNTQTILRMALQMGMINNRYHYLLTTLVMILSTIISIGFFGVFFIGY